MHPKFHTVTEAWRGLNRRLERVLKKKPNLNWKNEDVSKSINILNGRRNIIAATWFEWLEDFILFPVLCQDGLTPLFNATMSGSADFVEKLIKAGHGSDVLIELVAGKMHTNANPISGLSAFFF